MGKIVNFNVRLDHESDEKKQPIEFHFLKLIDLVFETNYTSS